MTQPNPTTEALEDCLRRLQAVCLDLDATAPAVSLTVPSAPSGARRELAQEAVGNLGVVRQQVREAALRLDVAVSLHRSAVSPWIIDQGRGGGTTSPRTG